MARPFWRPELAQRVCFDVAKAFVDGAELQPEFLKGKLALATRIFVSEFVQVLQVDSVCNRYKLLVLSVITGFVSAH